LSQLIATATAESVREQARAELQQHKPALPPAPVRPAPSMQGRKLPTPPPWWIGGEQATQSSLVAAQQLRQRGR